MKFGHILTLFAVCFLGTAIFSGCEADTGKSAAGHDDHGHKHAEGELPAHGPKGGHLFKLAGTELIGEWIHYSDNTVIRVYLLDWETKKAVPCEGITITPTAGDDKTPIVLEYDEESSGGEKGIVYMLDDERLNRAMSLGVEVEYMVGEEKFVGKIAPHAPHDH